MASDGVFLKRKSKQLAKLYDYLVFQVAVFDFIFPRKNTLYEEDRLIKHPLDFPKLSFVCKSNIFSDYRFIGITIVVV